MRVVDLAVRLGMGVGDTLALCRDNGIDASLPVSEVSDADVARIGALFQMDLATRPADPPAAPGGVFGSPPPAARPAAFPPVGPAPSRPVPPGPVPVSGAVAPRPGPPPAQAPAAVTRPPGPPPAPRPELGRLLDLDIDIEAEIHVLTGGPSPAAAGADAPGVAEDDEGDDGEPRFATLSGRHPGRRRRNHVDSAGGATEEEGALSASIDERWVPHWVRRAVLAALVVGVGTLAVIRFTGSDPVEVASDPDVAAIVTGTCFDLDGTNRVQASCLDAHDGQILEVILDDSERDAPYPGADILYADGALRCQSDPEVLAAAARSPVPVVVDAVVASAGEWEIGLRDVVCQATVSGPVPLGQSLLP